MFWFVLRLDGDVSGTSNDLKGDRAVSFDAGAVVDGGLGSECLYVGVYDKVVDIGFSSFNVASTQMWVLVGNSCALYGGKPSCFM